MFPKISAMKSGKLCGNEERMQDALSKNSFLVALLGSQYLFKILHTSLAFFFRSKGRVVIRSPV